MTVAEVVFVPSAPLLVPAVAGGAVAADAQMRDATLAMTATALAGREHVVVVAAGSPAGEWSAAATWDFSGFGVPRPGTAGQMRLPWALGIGAWLLDECDWRGSRRYVGVAAQPSADSSVGEVATAVIVVADGSACRTEKAPGYLDDRAEAFDAGIETALRRGDIAALAGTDEVLAGELLCRSVPAWRWLAAAAGATSVVDAAVMFAAAPYGVAYFVAGWTLSG